KRSAEIFFPDGPASDVLLLTRGYRYGVERLFKVVTDVLGPFATKVLNDLPVDIMLTAIAEKDGRAWYFVKDKQANAGTTGKFLLAECATASGAAPTYFDSFRMSNGWKMVDGGLGVVGNPVYQACVEAFEFSDGKYNPAETQVFSLGTGIAPAPTQPAGDLLSKLKWILDVALEAPKNQQTEM